MSVRGQSIFTAANLPPPAKISELWVSEHNTRYITGYIQQLENNREQLRAQRAKQKALQSVPLTDRIERWWCSIPECDRQNFYRIEYLSQAFNTVPRLIGPALFKLGWVRKRLWKVGYPHYRVWHPPTSTE